MNSMPENREQRTENREQRTENINGLDSLCQDVVFLRYEKFIVVNPDKDTRLCRTLKTQYYKNSIANIFHKGTFGCTGVIQIIKA